MVIGSRLSAAGGDEAAGGRTELMVIGYRLFGIFYFRNNQSQLPDNQ
jgi:hypothetical protein